MTLNGMSLEARMYVVRFFQKFTLFMMGLLGLMAVWLVIDDLRAPADDPRWATLPMVLRYAPVALLALFFLCGWFVLGQFLRRLMAEGQGESGSDDAD